ncbi:MAG: hypothetical protein ACJAWV_003171 [Flammeovirgaceae bacterium]|jgi:hypothetical protein
MELKSILDKPIMLDISKKRDLGSGVDGDSIGCPIPENPAEGWC